MMPLGIVILTVGQMKGALWPKGRAEWLHVPNLRRLARPSVRFVNSHTSSAFRALGRPAFMSGALPLHTGICESVTDCAPDLPNHPHFLRRVGCQICLSLATRFVGPDQPQGFAERLTTDVYPAVSDGRPAPARPARGSTGGINLGEADPQEMTNLASDPDDAGVMPEVRQTADALEAQTVRQRGPQEPSPPLGRLRGAAPRRYRSRSFQPLQKPSKRYMRNHMDLNVLEESQPFPPR